MGVCAGANCEKNIAMFSANNNELCPLKWIEKYRNKKKATNKKQTFFLKYCYATLEVQNMKNLAKSFSAQLHLFTQKNGFVTSTKLGTTNKFFVAATKNFAAATKRFVDRTKHFVVETKYFCYAYFNK